MDITQLEYISKKELVQNLKDEGWTGISGEFSGGHDEGGWDNLYLFKTKRGVICDLKEGELDSFRSKNNQNLDGLRRDIGAGEAFSKKVHLPHQWEIYEHINEGAGWVNRLRDHKYGVHVPGKGCPKIPLLAKEKKELLEKKELFDRYSCFFDKWLNAKYGSFAGEYSVYGSCFALADGQTGFKRNETMEHYEEYGGEF